MFVTFITVYLKIKKYIILNLSHLVYGRISPSYTFFLQNVLESVPSLEH